jgi:hypothetical protein
MGCTMLIDSMCKIPNFYRQKLKLAILMAPVVTINNISSKIVQQMVSSETLAQTLKSQGPELFASPRGNGFISSTLLQLTGLSDLTIG